MNKNSPTSLFFLLMFLPGWGFEANAAGQQSCVHNLRMLDGATDQVAIEMNLKTGNQVAAATISEYIRGGVESLNCPKGGRYTFGTVGREPRCSVHGTISDPTARGKAAGARELWGREPETETEVELDRILVRMSREQDQFDPGSLREANRETLRALADRFFPQAANIHSEEEVEKRVHQLGADAYPTRERASKQLKRSTTPFRDIVEKAARTQDPEVRRRALNILSSWEARDQDWKELDFAQYEAGLRNTLETLKQKPGRTILADQAKHARATGPINASQKILITLCLPTPEETLDH